MSQSRHLSSLFWLKKRKKEIYFHMLQMSLEAKEGINTMTYSKNLTMKSIHCLGMAAVLKDKNLPVVLNIFALSLHHHRETSLRLWDIVCMCVWDILQILNNVHDASKLSCQYSHRQILPLTMLVAALFCFALPKDNKIISFHNADLKIFTQKNTFLQVKYTLGKELPMHILSL